MENNNRGKRLFYVVYFLDPTVQALLDAIRLLSNPQEKGRAHITIRGPYSKQQHFSKLERLIRGTPVVAEGLGTFFNEGQNTVFIRCDSENLRKAWKKRDYGYNPHITLYDGDSREFAEHLLAKLPALNQHFQIKADGLSPLLSNRGQRSCDLMSAFDSPRVSALLGTELKADRLNCLSTQARLDYVETIAQKLGQYVQQGQARTAQSHT